MGFQMFAKLFALAILFVHLPSFAENQLSDIQQKALGIRTSPPILDDAAVSTTALGQLQLAPTSQLTISRPFNLQVQKILVHPGEQVNLDQPLAMIYVPDLQTLEHRYHNAKTLAQLTTHKLQRETQLFKEGVISRKQFETTQAEAQQSEENLVGEYNLLVKMGLTKSELATLQGSQNHHLEGEITLNADRAGTINQINISSGQSITANSQIMTLLTSPDLTIDIPLTTQQLSSVSIGDQLHLEDNTPVTITNIQAKLSDAQKVIATGKLNHNQLKAGQWVTVYLPQKQRVQTWRLPRQAITYLNNEPSILILNQQHIESTPVKLIRATREGWVVECSALNTQSQVIVSGTAAAKGLLTGESE